MLLRSLALFFSLLPAIAHAQTILPGTTRIQRDGQRFASPAPGSGLLLRGSTSGAVGFLVPAEAPTLNYTLPAAAPATNSVLSATDTGTLSWVSRANWDSAYGWGNHGLAGYLTSLSGAVLTDQITQMEVQGVKEAVRQRRDPPRNKTWAELLQAYDAVIDAGQAEASP